MYSVRIELEENGYRKGRCVRFDNQNDAYEFFEMLKAVSDMMLAGEDSD